MKHQFSILALCIFSNVCFAQTQSEMNRDAYERLAKADSTLNAVYKAILIDYADDTEFTTNLKSAQRIWIQFRDAEIKAKFPERDGNWYGTMHSMCLAGYEQRLTEERTQKLREWLAPAIEGEGCNGSVKGRWKLD